MALDAMKDARVALTEAARMSMGPDGTAAYARGQLALLEMSESNWGEGSRQADIACAQIEESNLQNLLSSGAAQVAAAAAAAHSGDRGSALQRLGSLASIQKNLSDSIPFDAFQVNLIAAETYLLLGDHRAASVHARTASSPDSTPSATPASSKSASYEVQKALAPDGASVDAPESELEPLTDRELQIIAMLPE